MPHMMQTPIRRAIVVKACGVIAEAERPGRPTASAAASATCVSYCSAPMTERRSHDHGVPRLPESAMTPSRMPTLGSAANVALAVMVRFIFVLSIPMATPAR